MPLLSPELLDQALLLTAERLEQMDAPAETLVVCGGSALLALGLVRRATRDVDVLASVDPKFGLVDPRPFSAALSRVVEEVGATLDLPRGWFNAGPADQVPAGLPDGFLSRLIRREYGPRLIIHYPDRFDLIHLKLFAAMDQGPGRHTADLMKLAPTADEMLAAARWVLTQDASDAFPLLMRDALTQLGFPHVCTQL